LLSFEGWASVHQPLSESPKTAAGCPDACRSAAEARATISSSGSEKNYLLVAANRVVLNKSKKAYRHNQETETMCEGERIDSVGSQ